MSSNSDFNRACLEADREEEVRQANRGIASRNRAYRETLCSTRDPRRAIAAYCAGNKWLMENARAVGNLPPGW